jgi:pilus assembly protein FimV
MYQSISGKVENIRMLNKRAKLLALTVACSASIEALAAGLGEIRWFSGLNEALDAEIEVIFADPRELPEYSVAVLPNSAYALASGQMSAIVSTLQSELIESGRRVLIRVRSRGPVREPFLNFRVALTTPGTRLLRDYTVLLDPPFPSRTAPAAMAEPVVRTETPRRPERAPESNVTRQLPAAPESSRFDRAARQYGPTQRGDTLWAIARWVRPEPSLGIPETVSALHRANPHAFIGGDANLLKVGVTLTVPNDVADQVASQSAPLGPATVDSPLASPRIETPAPNEIKTHAPGVIGGIDYEFTVVQHSSNWAYAAPLGSWSDSDIAEARRYAATGLIVAEIEPSELIRRQHRGAPALPVEALPARVAQAEPVVREPVAAPAASVTSAQPASASSWPQWLVGGLVAIPFFFYALRMNRRQRLLEEELEVLRRRERKHQQRRAAPLPGPVALNSEAGFEASETLEKAPSVQSTEDTVTVSETEHQASTPKVIVRPQEDSYDATVVELPDLGEASVVADAPPTAASQVEEDLFNEIDLYIAYGRYEKARDLIQGGLEKDPDKHALKRRLAEVYYRTHQPEKFTRLAEELKTVLDPAMWAKVETMAENLLKDAPADSAVEAADESTQLIEDDLPQPEIGSLTDELEKMGISELPFADGGDDATKEVDYSKFESARFLK